jgi:hypothetical protein
MSRAVQFFSQPLATIYGDKWAETKHSLCLEKTEESAYNSAQLSTEELGSKE